MERATTKAAMDITGLKKRTLQSLAARGEIPGAAKLGRTWTFDVGRLRRWIAEQESALCRKTSTGGERLGTHESRSPGTSIDAAYEQLLSRSQKQGATSGLRI